MNKNIETISVETALKHAYEKTFPDGTVVPNHGTFAGDNFLKYVAREIYNCEFIVDSEQFYIDESGLSAVVKNIYTEPKMRDVFFPGFTEDFSEFSVDTVKEYLLTHPELLAQWYNEKIQQVLERPLCFLGNQSFLNLIQTSPSNSSV